MPGSFHHVGARIGCRSGSVRERLELCAAFACVSSSSFDFDFVRLLILPQQDAEEAPNHFVSCKADVPAASVSDARARSGADPWLSDAPARRDLHFAARLFRQHRHPPPPPTPHRWTL